MKWFILLNLLWLVFSPLAVAGEEVQSPPPPIEEGKQIEKLRALEPSMEEAEKYLADLRKTLKGMEASEDKEEFAKQVETQRERVAQLRENFRTLATGIESDRYLSNAEGGGSWQENLEDIIAPISSGVRELTSGPREMEAMRNELRVWQERQQLSSAALSRLDDLIKVAKSELIKKELAATRKLWASRNAEAASQVQVFSQQIEEREQNSPSTWEAVSGAIANFWRSKGLNLVIAILAAVAAFVLVRKIYAQVKRVSPVHRKKMNGLAARGTDLLAGALAGILALTAAVVVFYLRGDWLLLALSIIFVIGVLWASKRAIPPYIEQIRMILNIGSVRQGERLVYEGVPWRVDRMNFFCDFSNPDLEGGSLRLPVRDVMPLHSREAHPKEPWFPTRCDDWVILADETYGKVIQQTPEQVVVLRLGGSRRTYPTISFLSEHPENLSHGFRVSTAFGIDYDLQAISTTVVPDEFRSRIEEALFKFTDHSNVRSVKVEFSSAGASSLDYAILADFSGELASRVNVLRRLIQKTCIDVCNDQGWGIPFTQITVHQAPPK